MDVFFDIDHLLSDAIVKCDVNKVSVLLEDYDPEKLMDFRLNSSKDDLNIVERILMIHGMVTSSPGRKDIYTQRKYKQTDPEVMKIVDQLLNRQPKLLTEKCYGLCNMRNKDLLDVLLKYRVSVDGEDICYVCHDNYLPEELLHKICRCNLPIHHGCLKKLLDSSNGMRCGICKYEFRLNQLRVQSSIGGRVDYDVSIFSPWDDFYPVPLMTGQYRKETSVFGKIDMAIIYLQDERLKYLLENEVLDDVFRDYIKSKVEFKHPSQIHPFTMEFLEEDRRYQFDLSYSLARSMCSNYHRDRNLVGFNRCQGLIFKKLDDLGIERIK